MGAGVRRDRPRAAPTTAATDVSAAQTGGVLKTTVQQELERLAAEVSSGGAVASVFGRTGAVVAVAGDYDAAKVTFAPTGSVSSTTVQAAIAEVSGDADGAIPKALIDAKGDVIVGSAADTAARLPVGTNGQFLVADSSTSTGLVWMSVAFATALVGVDILRGLDVVMGERPETAAAITGSLSTVS